MANTLGTVVVDLQANTAAFVEGMTRASSAAKHAGGEIHESFSKIGEIAGSILAPFGEIGHVIGEAFGQIGVLGASAATSLGKMSGGMSFLAVGGGLAVGALAAVEAAAVGLTIHTAEAAAKMLILSQSAGISVETLSGFSFVAKQMGVDQETVVKSLEKLSKSIFAAATAVPGTTSAFSRMGIAVRDSNGNIRDAGDVIIDVAKKFQSMEDGTVKTALAIQLFGRGGAAIIPMLNGGQEAIEKWLVTARQLGIVLDTETAESAHKFEQDLNVISAAGQGVALQLTKALLPALDRVASALAEGLKDKAGGLSLLIEGIATLTKGTIAVGQTFWTAIEQIGLAFRTAGADVIIFSDQVSAMWTALKSGDFSGIARAYAEAGQKQKDNALLFRSESAKLWKDNDTFIKGVFAPQVVRIDESRFGKGGGGIDTSAKAAPGDSILARIKERLATLGTEQDEWLKVGQAGSQAEQLIADAVKKGTEEFGKLRDTAAHEKDPNKRAIALGLVTANEHFIEGAAAAGVYGAAIKAVVADLDKQHLKLQEETSATEALTAAYGTSGLAAALINSHFADQAAKVAYLKEAHDKLSAQFGEEDARVRQLADGYANASQKLETDKADYAKKVHADLSLEIRKTTTAFDNELPALKAIADAYFDTAAAARAAQVELKVAQFKTANPFADEAQINRVRELETRKSDQAFQNSVAEQAAKFDLIHAYDEEITRLDILREKLQEKHSSTLLVDAAEYDAQRKFIEQWDEAALKVGTFSQKFRATMNQVVLDGKDFGAKLFAAIGKAIDDLSSNLAKFVVTGKANFKQVFQGFEESIAKAGFQKIFSGVLGKLGFGGAPDGSESKPFHVIPVGGGLLGSGVGSGADGNSATSFFSSIGGLLSKVGGGIGGLFGGIGSLFGGFLEGGGDVTPGKAYIVGEKHPEFFVPKQAGQVTPSLSMGASNHHTSVVHMHIHGVTDFDSFKRSQGQIMAGMQRQLAIAHARNS